MWDKKILLILPNYRLSQVSFLFFWVYSSRLYQVNGSVVLSSSKKDATALERFNACWMHKIGYQEVFLGLFFTMEVEGYQMTG